jgi:hypothetical protein
MIRRTTAMGVNGCSEMMYENGEPVFLIRMRFAQNPSLVVFVYWLCFVSLFIRHERSKQRRSAQGNKHIRSYFWLKILAQAGEWAQMASSSSSGAEELLRTPDRKHRHTGLDDMSPENHKYHVGRKVKWSQSVDKSHRAKKAKTGEIVELCGPRSYKVRFDGSGEEREVSESELILPRAPRNPHLSATEDTADSSSRGQEEALLDWEAKVQEATSNFMSVELDNHETARIALRDVHAKIVDVSLGLDSMKLEGSQRERRRQLLHRISELETKIRAATPAAATLAPSPFISAPAEEMPLGSLDVKSECADLPVTTTSSVSAGVESSAEHQVIVIFAIVIVILIPMEQ